MKNGYYVFGNIDKMSYKALLKTKKYVDEYIASLTCEGEMKMYNIIKEYDSEKQEIIYDFDLPNKVAASDKVYTYAMQHNKQMRGHTLVWHKHEPKEVLDQYIADRLGYASDEYIGTDFFEKRKEYTKQFLALYMKKMGEQYPNCYCWDVLNEIVPELETEKPTEEEKKEGLRHSLWYEYLGKDFYIDILEIAKENLPEGSKLFYNEFGEQHLKKREAILKVIENIKEYEEKTGKTILDGIGLQSHYDLNVTPEEIEKIHSDFSRAGKEIQITEIDIMPGRDRKFDKKIFENLWKKVFQISEKYEIQAFTGWGLGDSLNWFSNIGAIPTMIDKKGNIKEFAKGFLKKQKLKIEMGEEVRSENVGFSQPYPTDWLISDEEAKKSLTNNIDRIQGSNNNRNNIIKDKENE